LEDIAARFGSNALLAGASVARGRVQLADGDVSAAELTLADGVARWIDVGAPYEAAVARALLAGKVAMHAAAVGTNSGNVFRREGDVWLATFDGASVRVRNRKGMHYLARLVANPGREFHALDLVAGEAGAAVRGDGDAGEMLDARAKDAYRRRLGDIDDDLAQAAAMGDPARAAQAESERDFLVRELSRAVGLGGRDRRAGAAPERARVSVTRALRQAIGLIAEHHTALGTHLERAIRTGVYCSYLPDGSSAVWIT
jgi:hypothetical protein